MILESISIIGFAILIDLIFGDPKNRYHPTSWIGILIAKFTPIAKHQNSIFEKIGGVLIIIIISSIVVLLLTSLNFGISLISIDYISLIVFVITGALLLKTTIAIRGMEKHATSVLESLESNNLDMARNYLSMIVKRNTTNLDKNHVLSGVLESISENTVDGVTGPMFYYAFFWFMGSICVSSNQYSRFNDWIQK